MRFAEFVARETAETLRRPSRLLNMFRPTRLREFWRFQKLRNLSSDTWEGDGGGVGARRLDSYEAYLELQKSKLGYLDLGQHESRFRQVLAERMGALLGSLGGERVICLGARLGAEVAAFRDLGCFAFGIDLNPGAENPWVLYGDFHDLKLPDASADLVYTNSLDHCLDLHRVLSEVKRILSPTGKLVVEADPGVKDAAGNDPDMWATFKWETIEALVAEVTGAGFVVQSSGRFEYPRHGTTVCFQLGEA